jgi:hypothetical protein
MAQMHPPVPKGGAPFAQPPAPPTPAQPDQQPQPPSPLFAQAMQALQSALEHHNHVTHVRRMLHPHIQKGVRSGPQKQTPAGVMGVKNALAGGAPPPVNPTATFSAKNMTGTNALLATPGGSGKPATPTATRGR